jgi:hypothetical protein
LRSFQEITRLRENFYHPYDVFAVEIRIILSSSSSE